MSASNIATVVRGGDAEGLHLMIASAVGCVRGRGEGRGSVTAGRNACAGTHGFSERGRDWRRGRGPLSM
jgi:hypothetical protein